MSWKKRTYKCFRLTKNSLNIIEIEIGLIDGANHFFSTHLDEAMLCLSSYLERTRDGLSMPNADQTEDKQSTS